MKTYDEGLEAEVQGGNEGFGEILSFEVKGER